MMPDVRKNNSLYVTAKRNGHISFASDYRIWIVFISEVAD
jgi:hypothetical protein